jgi:N-acetyl-anhydromuramyl-L-alanine amidase AmpD
MYNQKWIPSPFFTSRKNYPLDMIVIHHIGSKKNKLYSVNGTLTWFTNKEVHRNKQTGKIENKVSAHYVIPRQQHKGNDLYQLVADENIAYHAGRSQWSTNGKLRKYINRYSIGIELEGDGNLVEYTDYQYKILTWLIKKAMDKYKIKEHNIVGHEDIAPQRKVDPGQFFDWKRLRSELSLPETTHSKYLSTISFVEDQDFYMAGGSETKSKIMNFFGKLMSLFSFRKKS